MSTTTTKNPTPAELRELARGVEIEEFCYAIGQSSLMFAMLHFDDLGLPTNWSCILRETELERFAEHYRNEGEHVEFVPLDIKLPDISVRDTPCRMKMNASAEKSHATFSMFGANGHEVAS